MTCHHISDHVAMPRWQLTTTLACYTEKTNGGGVEAKENYECFNDNKPHRINDKFYEWWSTDVCTWVFVKRTGIT